jgi:phi13 family phage major tail protein
MAYIGKPIGVRNLTWFPLTKDEAGGETTYGEAIKLARAININMSPQMAEALLESDDGIEDRIALTTGYELTLDVSQISDEVRAQVFGHQIEQGGVAFKATDTPVVGALAFRALLSKEKGDDKYSYIVLYKGRLQEFDETFHTVERGGITFQTHGGIKGTFYARESDDTILYRMREDTEGYDASQISAWFDTPQKLTPKTPGA